LESTMGVREDEGSGGEGVGGGPRLRTRALFVRCGAGQRARAVQARPSVLLCSEGLGGGWW
jgi:hypothetical protein